MSLTCNGGTPVSMDAHGFSSFKKIHSNLSAAVIISLFILKNQCHFPHILPLSPQELHKFSNANIFSIHHQFWLRLSKDFKDFPK